MHKAITAEFICKEEKQGRYTAEINFKEYGNKPLGGEQIWIIRQKEKIWKKRSLQTDKNGDI
ncbi:MAG: hypothetical protein LUD15_08685 [Bacteroides sp.]|nr:hypothetical protein [Bacteroides sp.]